MSTDTPASADSPSKKVTTAIAERTGTDPEELRPLFEVVDLDALDALFTADVGTLTFPYEEFLVTVRGDGTVTVEELP